MSEKKTYVAVHTLHIPVFGEDGKPTERNTLVRAGEQVELNEQMAKDGLRFGSIRELESETESGEQSGDTAEQVSPELLAEWKAARPNNGTKTQDWAAFAEKIGIDPTDKNRDALIVECDDKLTELETRANQ